MKSDVLKLTRPSALELRIFESIKDDGLCLDEDITRITNSGSVAS